MKRAAWMLAIGFGCTAMVAAQDGSQTASQSAAKGGTITVTGCLQSGDGAGATGTTGSTSASPSASRSTSGSANTASFILTQATMGSSSTPRSGSTAAGSTAGGAASAGSATGTSGTASTYVLEPGSSQSELSSNTGKKVEVTGTIDTSMSGSSSAAGGTTSAAGTAGTTSAGTTAATGAGASGSMANAQHLKVSSVRVVGDSCR
jgi:hypothetical protein